MSRGYQTTSPRAPGARPNQPADRGARPARIVSAVLLVVALLLLAAGVASAETFDWRDYNGGDYTTGVRHQGSCGSCYTFAALALVESAIDIYFDDPNLDADLSEQQLLCEGVGSCDYGGHVWAVLNYVRDTGLVTEQELPYVAGSTSPDWPLAPEWENRVYRIETYSWVEPDDVGTVGLKAALRDYGPLGINVRVPDAWYWPPGSTPSASSDGPHSVALVGYTDDAGVPGGGYWFVKNSWGAGWGDDGYGYVSYEYILTESQGPGYFVYGEVYLPFTPGDCDRDGDVDLDDLLALRNGFGEPGTWENGDFGGDGMVDIDDLFSLRNNFGLTGGTHTPEPSTTALLVLGAVVMLHRRR